MIILKDYILLCRNYLSSQVLTAPLVAVQQHVYYLESVSVNQILEKIPTQIQRRGAFFSVRYMGVAGFCFTRARMWLEEIDIGGPSLPYF